MSRRGTMRASVAGSDTMTTQYTDQELRRAWRGVAAHYAARTTGLPVEAWQTYDGPIDVAAIAAEAELPVDDRDHQRAWRLLRAGFELRFSFSLFSDGAAA